MGSLVAALASYLQARAHDGRWLLRIEDLDPPREPPGAADAIAQSLGRHGLHHDGEISYQSQRHSLYHAALAQLRGAGRLYACNCTRAQLRSRREQLGCEAYDGHCRDRQQPEAGHALRLRLGQPSAHPFDDAVQGPQYEDLRRSCGDFVLRRRDGLFAYQLAVVVDDADQSVSEVVRGVDLLDNTARQIHLQQALGLQQPRYLHLPLQLDEHGHKLSKQNHAAPLDNERALQNLEHAWLALGQQPFVQSTDCRGFLQRAISHWQPHKIPQSSGR